MNAPFPKPASVDSYQERLDRSYHWRASCIQQFAEFELTVGSALQILAKTRKTGSRVKTGLPIRAAVEELKRLTAPKGSFAKLGKPLQASIVLLEPRLDWRTHLTHGVIDVWRGRTGSWLITLHHRETNNAGPLRWHAMPWEEAERWQESLAAEIRKFGQKCEALERQLTPEG